MPLGVCVCVCVCVCVFSWTIIFGILPPIFQFNQIKSNSISIVGRDYGPMFRLRPSDVFSCHIKWILLLKVIFQNCHTYIPSILYKYVSIKTKQLNKICLCLSWRKEQLAKCSTLQPSRLFPFSPRGPPPYMCYTGMGGGGDIFKGIPPISFCSFVLFASLGF